MKKRNYIATWTGRKFDLVHPRPREVDIRDIALGLSRCARFSGMTKNFLSVAEHSVNVAELLREWRAPYTVQLFGLLHDATEAYLGDVVRPLKKLLPSYKLLELRMERAILRGLGLKNLLRLSQDDLKLVKRADDMIAVSERRDQVNFRKDMPLRDFCDFERKPWARRIRGMEWKPAQKLFLARYKFLREAVRRHEQGLTPSR